MSFSSFSSKNEISQVSWLIRFVCLKSWYKALGTYINDGAGLINLPNAHVNHPCTYVNNIKNTFAQQLVVIIRFTVPVSHKISF